MKSGGIWIVLGVLILVVLFGIVSVELVRHRHFEVMKAEVESLVRELQAEVAIGSDSTLEFCESSAKGARPLSAERRGNSTSGNREFIWILYYPTEKPGSFSPVLKFIVSQGRDWSLGTPVLLVTHPGYLHMNCEAVLAPRCSAHGLKYTLEASGRVGG